ncbi:neutral amino acid transporter 9-like isoform X2 [Dermacentor andersoni]|uniref:neutral amino acid transporter 9-like isoform X2 n=1 Tax=Dermacentor andersoni TaxID=34620 RepID=UPI0021551736|nr:neutral amino acid transporter 9-like isoform X2 [Dermacentor andersoni]
MEPNEKSPLLSSAINRNDSETARSGCSSAAVSESFSSHSSRKPFHYPIGEHGHIVPDSDANVAATYSRYRYYTKLVDPSLQMLCIPEHVLPAYLSLPFFKPSADGEQSSFVTIFAIWNTMMGTSLLSMPWAISQAGFAGGIVLVLAIGLLCLYTAYRVLSSPSLTGLKGEPLEFSDVCHHFLGEWGERLAIVFSMMPLIGATVVFWVLMSTFLSNTSVFVYDHIAGIIGPDDQSASLLCAKSFSESYDADVSLFSNSTNTTNDKILDVLESKYTMPIVLVFLLFPVLNLKSPSFFFKFTSLGTISVFYLLIYIFIKAASWGININFVDKTNLYYTPLFKTTFSALTGVLCLSFFIHNCIISMMRNQRRPENNKRDLSIAFGLVITTYLLVAIPFYATFPMAKSCIEDNLLNNFANHDVMAFVTRIFLLVQYITLFPMITYLLRVQFMHWVYRVVYPGWKQVVSVNAVVVAMCVLFAIFLPQIGTILRYCGALSGLVYIFSLPCIIYMVALWRFHKLTASTVLVHGFIIVLGVLNFVSQFLLQYFE